MFSRNESDLDRLIRGIFGGVLLIFALFMLKGALSWVAGIFGIVLVFTAITGFCALYSLFGINTNKK